MSGGETDRHGGAEAYDARRVVLVRYQKASSRGLRGRYVGSGLLVNDRTVLTADHVAEGTAHSCSGPGWTRPVARVLRTRDPWVDLAVIELAEHVAGIEPLGFARLDRTRVAEVTGCHAVGYPRWKRTDARYTAQITGVVPTAENLAADAPGAPTEGAVRRGLLTLVGQRNPAVPPIPAGQGALSERSGSPWGGMSGAGIVVGGLVLGVIRAHNFAEGGASLSATPITAIDELPADVSRTMWDALGVADPAALPIVPVLATPRRGRAITIPHNVPPPSVFVGRSDELERLRRSLASRYPIICIEGLGGLGKTALALEVVSRCMSTDSEFEGWPAFDGYVWISAKGRVLTLSDVLSTVASVLDQPIIAVQEPTEQRESIYRLFRQSKYLLVVDNFEDVYDVELEDFINAVPEPSKFVVTSRTSMLANVFCVPIVGLQEADALELLSTEGDRLDLPSLKSGDQPELVAIYQVTGGAPLAMKWAAGQLAQLGQTLESVLDALNSARGDIFEEIFERSWSMLSASAQRLLSVIPIFASDAVRASLHSASALADPELDDALRQLVRLNLVDVTSPLSGGRRRYSIHQLTRAFVQTKSTLTPDELDDARSIMASWHTAFCEEYANGAQTAEAVSGELPNIVNSMRWCHEHELWKPLLECSIALREFLPDRGYWNEALELGNFGISASEALNDLFHVGRLCIIPMGWVNRYREDLAAAEYWYTRGLRAFEAVGDFDRAAWARLALANILLRSGRAREGRAVAEEVRDSGVGETPARRMVVYAAALIHLSELAFEHGDYLTATELAREARALSLETGYLNSTMSASYWLGVASLRRGHLDDADMYLKESIQLNSDHGVRMGIALCSAAMAELCYEKGDADDAQSHAATARELYERLGMRRELLRLQVALDRQANRSPTDPLDR